MGAKTAIQWTDTTWNPVRGCSRVSPGCKNCYAERFAIRYAMPPIRTADGSPHELDRKAGPFHGFVESTSAGPRWTGRVELIPDKLVEPLRWRKPRRVFVNSMSDLFHESLKKKEIAAVFAVMTMTPHITYQILTKRPHRMAEWFKWAASWFDGMNTVGSLFGASREKAEKRWIDGSFGDANFPPANIWLGVSVEDQATADERIPLLLQTPAAVRFVSAEPLLGPVNLREMAHFDDFHVDALDTPDPTRSLRWVIVGGESGPGARPFDLDWARSIRDQCRAAEVKFFFKQAGSRHYQSLFGCECFPEDVDVAEHRADCFLRFRDRKGGDPSEWPGDLRVREFPEVVTR